MARLLGQTGNILSVDSDGDFRVLSGRTRCVWPASMLEPVVGGVRGLRTGGNSPRSKCLRDRALLPSTDNVINPFAATKARDVRSLALEGTGSVANVLKQLEVDDPAAFQEAVRQMSENEQMDEGELLRMLREGAASITMEDLRAHNAGRRGSDSDEG